MNLNDDVATIAQVSLSDSRYKQQVCSSVCRPYDSATYEDELDDDEVIDEEGKMRLKLKVENTMRWRYAKDSDGLEMRDDEGNPVRESNARIVRWSDGR